MSKLSPLPPAVTRQIAEAKAVELSGETTAPLLPAIGNRQSAIGNSQEWSDVRRWVQDASRFQHASLACQVMAGFTLHELKKGFTQGGARQKPHGAVIGQNPHIFDTFADACKAEAGISDDTARRWVDMALGIKKQWKSLPVQDRLRKLMELPPSQWGEADMKVISDATHKCTDGKGQLEFMLELGIAKGGRTGANPGDKRGGNSTKAVEGEVDDQFALVCCGDLNMFMMEDNGKRTSTATLLKMQTILKGASDFVKAELTSRKGQQCDVASNQIGNRQSAIGN